MSTTPSETHRMGQCQKCGVNLIAATGSPITMPTICKNCTIENLISELAAANAKLSRIFHWIEHNHPDGFIDGESYESQLDKIIDRHHAQLESSRAALKSLDGRACKKIRSQKEQLDGMAEAVRSVVVAIKMMGWENYPDDGRAQVLMLLEPALTEYQTTKAL